MITITQEPTPLQAKILNRVKNDYRLTFKKFEKKERGLLSKVKLEHKYPSLKYPSSVKDVYAVLYITKNSTVISCDYTHPNGDKGGCTVKEFKNQF